MTRDSIIQKIKDNKIIKTLKYYGIEHIYLIGSYAKNQENKHSDIDLLYEQNQEKQLGREIIDLILLLEKVLGKKVDLIEKKFLNKHIKKEVLAHAINIF